ncbi:hypothetical protein YPPY52_3059, partial [Yersinia pestis PY-52]
MMNGLIINSLIM